MIAELIFAGTELLLGQILNTNAQFLSLRLAEVGVDVYHQTVVGDNSGRIEECFRLALTRADVIIASGGLGPTTDDMTREALAQVLCRELVVDQPSLEHIRSFFAQRGRVMTSNNAKQAMIPAGGRAIANRLGTAPGVAVEHEGKLIFLLPGPPFEMEPMVREDVLPSLASRQPQGRVIVSRVLRFCDIGESELETRLADLIAAQSLTTVAPLASLGEVSLRLTAKAAGRAQAMEMIAPLEAEVRARVGQYIYGIDSDTLAGAVVGLLARRGFSLAVAESCTGGLLSHLLTEVPGVSAHLRLAVVSYSNEAKRDLLGVPEALIARHGAVSAPVCAAMARGVLERASADLGVAITGLAGPGGGTPATPVGLVHIGLCGTDGERPVRSHRFTGNRWMVKRRAAQQALVALRGELMAAAEGSARDA
ncbi:MAG: competence/damage-inducible protein A [Bacillota bacterium]|nr:competence/damage-inducible protein A [Bacillota bacterium]